MAEKSEKATPKKLRDARKKGQVAKSQDFPSAITFVAAVSLTMYMLNFLYQRVGAFTLELFQAAPHTDLTKTAPFFLREMINVILITSLPIAGLVSLVGLIVGFLVVGPTFATEVFKPDIKKFNVVENLKQKFKMKTFVELLKSVFKLVGAGFLIYLVARLHIKDLVVTPALPPIMAFVIFQKIIYKVIIVIGIYFILIAVADLLYQKYNFAKEMKMEKFEVKQEYKDTEGNPEIKGKRKQLAQEIAYDDGAGQVRKAKTVITNPHDIACAIGYDPKKYKAPWIIEMGSGVRAGMIIRMAEKFDIPIMRNVPLAHQLLDEGEIHKFIPESTYDAIGEILLFVESLRAEEGKRDEEEE
ncbi:MAG: Yop proteins translocation protein U [Chlamydiales bacterium]|nr:Yop proteins translocation protein U [Chlamydiales bacterium]MCH9635587.1 Yop proteins translocation protein U [Chlamydiales bacterium]MCH9703205.1 flagellar type III secretion system protein FlhB [Chlamydiota bacterium]